MDLTNMGYQPNHLIIPTSQGFDDYDTYYFSFHKQAPLQGAVFPF